MCPGLDAKLYGHPIYNDHTSVSQLSNPYLQLKNELQLDLLHKEH